MLVENCEIYGLAQGIFTIDTCRTHCSETTVLVLTKIDVWRQIYCYGYITVYDNMHCVSPAPPPSRVDGAWGDEGSAFSCTVVYSTPYTEE